MKKKYFICIILFIFTGCNQSFLNNIINEKTNITEWEEIEEYYGFGGNKISYVNNIFVETKEFILFVDTRDNILLKYINKKDGEVSLLCNDIYCKHNEESNCISICDMSTINSLNYNFENNLVVFVKCNNRLSVKNDRYYEIYMMEINGDYHNLNIVYKTEIGKEINSLKFVENKLYFIETYYDNDQFTSIKSIDINTYELKELNTFNDLFTCFSIMNNNIIYLSSNNELYRYDIISNNIELIIKDTYILSPCIFSNKIYYANLYNILEVDFNSMEKKIIYESNIPLIDINIEISMHGILYFFYYTDNENMDKLNTYNIYCIKYGNIETIYSFEINYEILAMSCIGNNLIVKMKNKIFYLYNTSNIWKVYEFN